jgi:DNA-binding MarR family transcriptional regulator
MIRTMLLLKELPTSKSLEKFLKRYPDADIKAISDFAQLLRAASDISDALDRFLLKHGLLQGRWWVLVLLLRQDELTCTPSELAEKTGVTKATMTGFLDGLEREGLVERISDKVDRRKMLITLTSAGQKRLDDVMPDYHNQVHNLMNNLSVSERDAMLHGVRTLAANTKTT